MASLDEPRRLVFRSEEIDPAALGFDDILCETIVTAISPGTELAAYSGAPPLRPGVVYPRLVGYCNVARVLQCGAGVQRVARGDRVLTFTSHRSHFRIGASDVLAVIPVAIRSEDAACAYLFHLGYSAVLRANVRLGSTVVVLGLGVLGLGAVAMSALAGARVFGISNYEHSRERAQAMGAEASVDREHLPELEAALGERRASVVISTSNGWDDWAVALKCAGDQGTIAVLGFPGRTATDIPANPLDSAHFYMRQLSIVAVGQLPERPDPHGFLPFNVRDNIKRILMWIQAGALRPADLVAGEFAGGDLGEAYDRLLRRDGSSLTYLLRWST